ncbi:MAG TPA: pyruvate kinase [Chloroflexota bacterium]|nr:pyruvate kinase [Chloroflexota bacterium]
MRPQCGGTATRLAKIQATLGPASSSLETLHQMADAGMDGCRLNMSHCTPDTAAALAATVRRLAAERGRPIPLGADIRGPKLRIGEVRGGRVVLDREATVRLIVGRDLSDATAIYVDYPHLTEDLRPGKPVLLNDGLIQLRVKEVRQGTALCLVEKGGELTSRKGLNLPGTPLQVPSLTPKDRVDLALAVEVGVDFLMLSFARSAAHVREVRAAVAGLGARIPLVAKIERQEGVDALREIVDAADGICVARGDLGIETPVGAPPEIQREAADLCRHAGKFVMNGGQLLSSMVSSPIPLRAEVADLSAAVMDGLDAVVLSDETAAGDYPVEAVRIADQVMARAEQERTRRNGDRDKGGIDGSRLGAVVVVSPDGQMAERLSASRGASPIVAVVERPDRANWLATCWGVLPVLVEDCAAEGAVQQALQTITSAHPSLRARRFLMLEDRRAAI